MTTNLNYALFGLTKLINHNRFDRNHFNHFYHVLITRKTYANMSGSFVSQLTEFILKFK
jgi:hypothetical protein